MALMDSLRTRELLASIETNQALDAAQVRFLKRERQYDELRQRTTDIRNRCAAIAEAIPDANAKTRTALQNERRDLLAELSALPMDLKVSARLFAQAAGDFYATLLDTIASERTPLSRELDSTHDAVIQAQYDVKMLNERPRDPRLVEAQDRYQALIAQREPLLARVDDLDELAELVRTYVTSALQSTATLNRPGGVKFGSDNRPLEFYVNAFVAESERHAA